MPEREPLSGPDNAWRRMGEANNLMTITGILMFEEKISYDTLCDRLEERLLRFDRFTQRIGGRKRRIRRPYWETVEDFDIHNHVYELSLPEPQDKETFQEFIGTLMSRPLDKRRPLWEMFLLQDAGPTDGNAVVVRINHSIGDGFALLYVMLGLVDDPEAIEFPIGGISVPPRPDLEGESTQAEVDGGVAVGDDTVEPADTSAPTSATAGGDTAGGETEGSRERAAETEESETTREKASGSGPLDAVETATRGVKTAYDLLTMPDEPATSFSGRLGPTKRAGWTEPIDLADVKAIGETHDATVNDVLLGAAAGAIRRVLEYRGEPTDGLELHFTIPVNLRPMEKRDESLGNYFGLVFAPVPVGTRDLDERIAIIHDQMDVRKAGVEAFLMYQLLNVGGRVPDVLQERVQSMFEKQATGIVTNVPGPVDAVEFAGTEIRDIIFWVPQANDQGLGLSFISYNGAVRIGVAGDANLLPDPDHLTEAFEAEIADLVENRDE